jgi:hypothetical protein
LKLKCDEALSNVVFNFNVRRYTWAAADSAVPVIRPGWGSAGRSAVSKPALKARLVSTLETKM